STLTVSQGTTSVGVTVSVVAQNGFSGTVQVVLGGLPSGVTSSPASPFPLAAGASTAVLFSASSSAQTGNFSISAQGTSGNLSHSAGLTLTVQVAATSALPRSTFVRTDSVAVLDFPAGEPAHRHLVYDSAHHLIFVANRAMNRVEVLDATALVRSAQVALAGASSVDLSPDSATLWAGTLTNQLAAIDPQTLQIKTRFIIPALTPLPNIAFDRPEELLAMSTGNLAV